MAFCRIQRLKTSVIVAATLVVLGGSAASPASAGDSRTSIEVTAYAAEFGVSDSEAEKFLELQNLLDAPIAAIVRAETGRIAGFGIEHHPRFTGYVVLQGHEPPSTESLSIVDKFPGLIEIRTGADHTIDELLSAIKGLPDEVRQGVTFTDVDVAANAVVLGALRAADADTLTAQLSEVSVRTVVMVAPYDEHTTVLKGGQAMSSGTAGFAVKNSSGARGIATAAHLPNSLTQSGVTLTYQSGALNPVMDVQWHRPPSPHTVADDFWNGEGYIDVGSVISRSNSAGDFVCHYGKNSGNSCGYVTSIYYAPGGTYCGGLECDNVWIKVAGSSLRACSGDSGGPWYNGNKAYGVQSGKNGGTSCTSSINYAFFTSSTYFSNLGISILTY